MVRVWELEAADLLAVGDPGLIPWVPLARTDRPPAELLTKCRDRLNTVPDPRDRAGLMAVTVILSGLAYPGVEVLKLFGGTQAMIESPVLDEMKALIESNTLRSAAMAVLEARFGSVPDSVRTVLAGVTGLDRLQGLHRIAITCSDVAAFQAAMTP